MVAAVVVTVVVLCCTRERAQMLVCRPTIGRPVGTLGSSVQYQVLISARHSRSYCGARTYAICLLALQSNSKPTWNGGSGFSLPTTLAAGIFPALHWSNPPYDSHKANQPL